MQNSIKNREIDNPDSSFILVPLSENHLPVTLAWRNREDVRVWFNSKDLIELSTHLEWYKNYQNKADDIVYIAIDKISKEPLAQVAIYHIDLEKGRAEFGRLICNPNYRGQGIIKPIIIDLLKHCNYVLMLHEIYLEVVNCNDRAINLYKTIGFETIEKTEKSTIMAICLQKNVAQDEPS